MIEIPSAALTVIPGAGHVPSIESPTAVSRVVLFLARRGARREGETGETATQVEGECLEDYRSRSSCSTRSATYSFKSDW